MRANPRQARLPGVSPGGSGDERDRAGEAAAADPGAGLGRRARHGQAQAMAGPVTLTSPVLAPAAPDQVWQAVVGWPGQHRRIIAACVYGGQGPGATVAGQAGTGPLGLTDTMVITRCCNEE